MRTTIVTAIAVLIQGTPYSDDELENIDLVSEAHERGIPVIIRTINTWYETERLIDVGVDNLITDYSELLRWGARQ